MKCLWGNESERERERETKENEYLDGDKNQGNVILDLKCRNLLSKTSSRCEKRHFGNKLSLFKSIDENTINLQLNFDVNFNKGH